MENSFNEGDTEITTPVDNECCGVTIYEKKLQNINKCIIQHIKNTKDRLTPEYTEWKEVDEELNECKSPQPVLAKTSNCHYIVNEYSDNINSLLCLLNESTEHCGQTISEIDQERMAIWTGNIKCQDGSEGTPVEYGDTGYTYLRCG